MELSVLTTSITEPITNTDVKSFMGYPATDTSQDTTIDSMIKAAREFLEGRTALSLVSKSYKVYFDIEDLDDGWFELPVSPVLDTPAITCEMNGVSTTFEQKGLKTIRVAPDSVFSTILVGATVGSPYGEVIFQAGATNATANNILLELVSIAFNNRDGGGSSYARLPYDLRSRIDSISNNI